MESGGIPPLSAPHHLKKYTSSPAAVTAAAAANKVPRGILCRSGSLLACRAAQPWAMRHASPNTYWGVTPSPAKTSFFTIKIACSKSFGSGESTTITRREVPFTTGRRSFLLLKLRFHCFPCRGNLYFSLSMFFRRQVKAQGAAIVIPMPPLPGLPQD